MSAENADDDHCLMLHTIVGCVASEQLNPQSRRQLLARSAALRKPDERFIMCMEDAEKVGGNQFGSLRRNICPEFSQILFGCICELQRERVNNCLPRAIMAAVSNALMRPAATSFRPLSISDFRPSSSMI